MHNQLLSLVITLIAVPAWGATILVPEAEGNLWQCSAFDREDKQWVAKAPYEQMALNKAFEACKKHSREPRTCKTAKEYCEANIKGLNSRPMWQCTAVDRMAKAWLGDFFPRGIDAAMGAKTFCIQHSAVPDTCYVNLVTCKNTNVK
ncbi:hypothetical protein [Legionella septentrionalis]|uniref:DUF4189 domain-containing protein n=1 Tax=Legionella septentrionalis TaxID=2498109 RepID=A0A3S0VB68_9GAMM|nr:hypothetical protein [Legionella septentrionalis]RUQ89505.1 hypothetical protein EKM59_03655 [Legionella septentrionalis]RUQ97345.1 hypothetical protein ELY11_06775 [Legionella septentrionalis]RUR16138.1 hypothetical protein ELY10_04360 [Legionella septentrionalis]